MAKEYHPIKAINGRLAPLDDWQFIASEASTVTVDAFDIESRRVQRIALAFTTTAQLAVELTGAGKLGNHRWWQIVSISAGAIYGMPRVASGSDVTSSTGWVLSVGDRIGLVPGGHFVAGTDYVGQFGAKGVDVDITFSMAAAAHTTGQLLADSQIIAACTRANDVRGWLESFILTDEDDQATPIEIDVIFMSVSTSLGTEGGAMSITDANARGNIEHVETIAASAWRDMGGFKVAVAKPKTQFQPVSGSDDLYVGLVARGSTTPTASGITGKFKFIFN